MPTFGSVDCEFIKGGEPDTIRESFIEFQVVGIDGHGYHLIGRRGEPYTVTLVQFGDDNVLDNWLNSIRAMQATFQSYTDDHDSQADNVFVESIGRPRKTTAYPFPKRCELEVTVRPVA